ncbi:MAG: hypothetical protein AAFV53_01775 [Myxococcota bacterium]
MFIQTDELRYLVGVGPVVIAHQSGDCFPFLSVFEEEKAVQNWKKLETENRARIARGAAPLMTDTTKHRFTYPTAIWILHHVGWGGFKKMMDVAGKMEGGKTHHLNGHHRIGDVFRWNVDLEPGEALGDHINQRSPMHIQIFFNTVTLHLAGNQHEISAGQSADIQPGQPFRIENTSNGRVSVLLLSSAV